MRRSSRSWSVITVKSRATSRHAVERGERAASTRLLISLRNGQPATVRAMSTSAHVPSASSVGAADHAEVDDRAVQLGILDRPQGLDDLLVW